MTTQRTLIAALLAFLLLAVPPAPTAPAQERGAPHPLLAYIARVTDTTRDNIVDVDDAGVLYLAREGEAPFALTGPDSDVMALAWSPAGSRLAFHAYFTDTDGDRAVTRDDNASIFVFDFDCLAALEDCAVTRAQLTDAGANDRFPTWSPDGARIAFAANDGASAAIEIVDAGCAASEAGCAASRERLAGGAGLYLDPVWSPDGRYIAFLALVDTHPDGVLSRLQDAAAIYLAEVSSGTLLELVPANSPKAGLAWSPNGAWLAYTAITDTDGDGFIDYLYDHAQIFVKGVEAPGAPIPLTGPEVHASDPAWAPDGRRLAYSALTDTSGDGWLDAHDDSPNLFIAEFASGLGAVNARALTSPDTLDYAPAWSPDGSMIAYVALPARAGGGVGTAVNRFGNIFVIDADCATDCAPRQVSSEEGDDFAPAWALR